MGRGRGGGTGQGVARRGVRAQRLAGGARRRRGTGRGGGGRGGGRSRCKGQAASWAEDARHPAACPATRTPPLVPLANARRSASTGAPAPASPPPHLFRSKCQIHQWPMDAHSFRGLPRKVCACGGGAREGRGRVGRGGGAAAATCKAATGEAGSGRTPACHACAAAALLGSQWQPTTLKRKRQFPTSPRSLFQQKCNQSSKNAINRSIRIYSTRISAGFGPTLKRKRSTGFHFSIVSFCTGCQAVSSTSLEGATAGRRAGRREPGRGGRQGRLRQEQGVRRNRHGGRARAGCRRQRRARVHPPPRPSQSEPRWPPHLLVCAWCWLCLIRQGSKG